MTEQGETITVPRPKPDEAVIAVCDADGAIAWVKPSKTAMRDGGFLAQMVPLLEDSQRIVHEQRDGKAGS